MAVRLRDKVAIVTGAANGIGRRTARRFAEEGARVVVSDVQDEAGQAVVERIRAHGGAPTFVRCDILREEDLRALVAAAVGAYGRLDVLVANAMVTAARNSLGYEVGKAALFNLCRQVTVDYGPQGIRANAVCPGGSRAAWRTTTPRRTRRAPATGARSTPRGAWAGPWTSPTPACTSPRTSPPGSPARCWPSTGD
jgi:NAD(P)-dependent dehydrogenase (short-subunit alcohol dehydrogenase family)